MKPKNMFDCIIVLANEMDQEGKLNSESEARMRLCQEYFEQNNSSKIVTSGWAYRTDSELPISEAFKKFGLTLGIPESVILIEQNARDTVGDAYFTKKNIILPNDWKNILVITSDYHVERTSKIFNFIYSKNYSVTVKGASPFSNPEKLKTEENSLTAFKNTFDGVSAGDDSMIYKALITKHPFYNGDIYPKLRNI